MTSRVGIPQQGSAHRGGDPAEHAAHYAAERHWEVLPGAWLEQHTGVLRCSCADEHCDAPGAHPLTPVWETQVAGSATAARALWAARPRASVLLPTGRSFDVLEVPEHAGCLALARMERMGISLGPVSATPTGRMMFFVLAGSAARTPVLLRRSGWAAGRLDLTAHGEGGYIPAPPTRMGPRGLVQWVRRPTVANRWLPDAEELVPPLAYGCGQSR
ncbi:bifunctional DNA primase/polymerase [Streptomyces aidingensis]|uniref:bifunctional DNA primase/polymerase n=1 Tax=Streptomyces aidingensis TaxID=910347 RepID=UPI001FE3C716|nr:bifunctional DNA primase/polymerase [Streptomyces aidingensis]